MSRMRGLLMSRMGGTRLHVLRAVAAGRVVRHVGAGHAGAVRALMRRGLMGRVAVCGSVAMMVTGSKRIEY